VSTGANDGEFRFQTWIVQQWSRAALVCAVVLFALLPVLATGENRTLILAASLLPVYMIHQYEEHAHGRFIAFVNAMVGHDLPFLNLNAVFVINIVGVWIVFLASYWLARFVTLDVILVPVYLTLVNGIIHVLTSLRLRRYNPGLWTGLVLFLPWGGYLLWALNGQTGAGWVANLLALLFALALHAVSVVYILRRR
jgi:hypothetical protein